MISTDFVFTDKALYFAVCRQVKWLDTSCGHPLFTCDTSKREAKIEILSLRVTKISFSQFTAKVKVLELRVLYSAYINMPIAVRLSLSGSLYDLQKRRYDFSAFAKRAWPKNAQNRKISFGIQSYFDQSIIISHLRSFQHSYLKCSKRLFWRPWRLYY